MEKFAEKIISKRFERFLETFSKGVGFAAMTMTFEGGVEGLWSRLTHSITKRWTSGPNPIRFTGLTIGFIYWIWAVYESTQYYTVYNPVRSGKEMELILLLKTKSSIVNKDLISEC